MPEQNVPRDAREKLKALDEVLLRQQRLLTSMNGIVEPAEYETVDKNPTQEIVGLSTASESISLSTPSECFIPLHMRENSGKRCRRKGRIFSRIAGLMYYIVLISVVAVAFFLNAGGEGTRPPRSFAGFTPQIVLSRSMQDEIPQNSFVISKTVDPAAIEIGDDITYLRSANITVTHRVIQIYEDYRDGQRGFMTQGVMNPAPDKDIVPAANVVGTVLFQNLPLGLTFKFIRQNILTVGIMSALILAFFVSLFRFIKKDKPNGNTGNTDKYRLRYSKR